MVKRKHNNYSIRACVISFSTILVFMLYQTSDDSGTGTIIALVTMLTTAFLFAIQNNQRDYRIPEETFLLVAFTAFLAVTTLLQTPRFYLGVEKIAAQTLLTSLLCVFSVRENEEKYLKNVLELTVFFYSIAIIVFCSTIRNAAYIHSSIVVFGAVLDPNFIGLPLTPGGLLILYDLINKKKGVLKVLYLLAYTIIFVAIIETSSRGSFLAFAFGSSLIYINYTMKKASFSSKIGTIILLFILVLLFNQFILPSLTDNFNRATDFGDSADNGRYRLWANSITVWKKNLLFGGGLGSVYLYAHKGSHSIYFQLLAETGIVGITLFGRFLYLTFRHAFFYDRLYGIIVITSLFQIAFLNTLDNRCFWAILGWISLLPYSKNKQHYRVSYFYDKKNKKISKKMELIDFK